MAKNVFRATEIVNLKQTVVVEPPPVEVEEIVEAEQPLEEYTGPTADDLRREAEMFKAGWEKEKAEMTARAKAEADRIIKEAEKIAFEEVQKKNNQAQKIRQEAEDAAKITMEEARQRADSITKEAQDKVEKIEKDAFKKGYEEGKEEGFKEGRAEVERLIEQIHLIINKAIEKRNEIIAESETQLINLVLLISQKVIKVISENQKNVVVNNVIQALRKLKTRGDVVIRVNLADVQLTSEHVKDFMRMVENVKNITVLEDSSVDRGGCIIETDFGQIDARVSSQFHEIEEKIIELVPIKVKGD
ncbi:MAG: flagellar assembly protein FliH [Spirochaetota bacterium]